MVTHLPKRKPEHRFILRMMLLSVFWIILYIALHAVIDSDSEFAQVDLKHAYRITPQGEFLLIDVQSVKWVMGEDDAKNILARLDERTGNIRTLISQVKIDIERLTSTLKQEGAKDSNANQTITEINAALFQNNCNTENSCNHSSCLQPCSVWDTAYQQTLALSIELAQLKNFNASSQISARLVKSLAELQQQAGEQYQDIKYLRASKAKSFFWSSPIGSSVEIIFFAIFGVLANLLVNSAEYLRNNNFKASERWVAYSKLIYGPILAWILVTAIAVGWFDLGDYQVGIYSLPLLAFIFGFYSRKTVSLFDKLGKRIFGSAQQSVAQGPADIIARRKAFLAQFTHSLKPRSITELKRSAFQVKDEMIKTIVLEQEAKK
ncbi:hypothetical protein J7384_12600 [Endozoicomonas sp. G2_1]|uniref:hypothetical protein n=1 Tax=Endozoicomonas sp. G2_1 TaxID=2821091 RepID=UPI001ADAF416|nr:hypothetical protein [Endozoicomonas sp. G2_1]MBO9491204.1 hypothetical protein [Endozoicomonas sp. G2_1]